jgi:hypothetical protein
MSLVTRYEYDELDGRTELIVEHAGKEVLRSCDGGEPEDNSFYRDWAWVADAIEMAYKLGVDDGHCNRKPRKTEG